MQIEMKKTFIRTIDKVLDFKQQVSKYYYLR